MKILVIIVSYNFERWIDRCLNSLRQSEQQADVVVIDTMLRKTVPFHSSRAVIPKSALSKAKRISVSDAPTTSA